MIKRAFQFSAIGILYHFIVWYIGYNGWIWFQTVSKFDSLLIYSVIVLFLAYSFPLWRLFSHNSFLKMTSYYWLFLMQYLLFLLPIGNLLVFLHVTTIETTGYLVVSCLLLLLAYGTYHAYRPIVRTYSIHVDKENKNYPTLRIVMASDMHFGMLSGKSHATRLVQEINSLKADLVLFPGDIIDDDPTIFLQKNIGDILSTIQSTLGVYAVTGNHDYYSDKTQVFLDEMKRIGIKMLLDETICIDDSFYLIGRKDYSVKKRQTIDELMKNVNPTLPMILLDHQPYALDVSEANGIDISLSGHTHRGQMAPGQLITRRVFELDWGYKRKGSLHAFVSSGYGFWGPAIRIGSRCEIFCIDVSFEQKNA